MSDKNINQLAELLAAAVGIEEKETVEDTIEAAIEKLNKNKQTKPIAKAVKDDVKDELKEQIADMYVSNMTPPFWDRVRAKYLGVPDLKSWAELDKLNKQALSNCCDEDVDYEDSDFDKEEGITWQDIEDFYNKLTVDEYMHTCYDDDEWEDDDEQDHILSTVRSFKDLDDQQLEQKLNETKLSLNNGITANQLVEALTLQQRLQRAIKLRSKAKQIALKRKIALKKHATPEKITDRAHKLALRMLKSKFAGNKPYNELTYNERERVEKILANKKSVIDTLTRKMIPVVRKIEQQRFSPEATKQFNEAD